MSEEKKRSQSGSKIIEFSQVNKNRFLSFTTEDLEDPELDEMTRESFKQEADLLEEEMNHDPELMGVGASDDLFLSIVDKLKEQGVWEEEEACEKQEDIYRLLSEEDQQALMLGREVSRKKEEQKIRKQKQRRNVRRIASVAAVFVVVFMVGMTSEANRRLVLNAWDAVMTMAGFRVVTNYTDESVVSKGENAEEELAWKDAAERLGITPLAFVYMPEGMNYEEYEVMENIEIATFIYSMKNYILDIKVTNSDDTGSMYFVNDEGAELVDTIDMDKKVTAKIWRTNPQMKEDTYFVEFIYMDCRYTINGMISLDEIKKILKNTIFL